MRRGFCRKSSSRRANGEWPTSNKRGYFEGRIAGSRFKIHRITGYQNSFVPIIEGNFRRDGLGTLGDAEHAAGVAGGARLDRHHRFPGVEFRVG